MRTCWFAGFVLMLFNAAPLQAMISFGYLSPEQAEKDGLTIKFRAAGPNDVWVEVSFPTDGKWQAFAKPQGINYVQLRLVNPDDSLGLRTNLREDRSVSGRVAVSFTADRDMLHQTSVWITRRIVDVADVIRMEDFIALEDIEKDYKVIPAKGE